MANYYYLTDDRKPVGPISLEQLRELGHQGVVRAETYVAREGDPQWLPYAQANLPQPLASPIPIPPLSEPVAKRTTPGSAGAAASASVSQALSDAPAGSTDAPTRKKSRAWMWILLVVLILAVLLAVGTGAFFKLAALRTAEPYVIAVARVQSNPQAVALLGPPVQPGWLTMGKITSRKDTMGDETGTAKLSIPVKGPKTSGTVQVVGDKRAGVWLYSQMELGANSQTIDLRQEQEKAQTP